MVSVARVFLLEVSLGQEPHPLLRRVLGMSGRSMKPAASSARIVTIQNCQSSMGMHGPYHDIEAETTAWTIAARIHASPVIHAN